MDATYPLISFGFAMENSSVNVSQNTIYVNVSVTEANENTVTFFLHNATGGLVNSSFFVGGGVRTLNFTGVVDGNYSYNVTVNDSVGNSNSTSTRVIMVDDTNPVVTFSCSPTSVQEGNAVSCSCTATDNIDNDPSISFTSNPSTGSTGTFTTQCLVSDYTGNSFIESMDYSVTAVGGGGGGGGDGGGGGGGDIVCVPSFDCGDWSECIDGERTRECSDLTCGNDRTDTQVCDICVSNWDCSAWSSCENGKSTRECLDLNGCAENKMEEQVCEIGECVPNVQCSDWEDCEYQEDGGVIVAGELILAGQAERECLDLNGCLGSFIEGQACESVMSLNLDVVDVDGVENLEGRNNETGNPIFRIDLESLREGKLDIVFLQDEPDGSSCYNGVLDEGEEGVDCGGNCRSCENKRLFIWNIWALILIWVFVFMGVRLFLMKKKNILGKGSIHSRKKSRAKRRRKKKR